MAVRDLQTVLDAVLSGVIVLNRDGRIELVNDEASRILDLSDAAALGESLDTLLPPDHMLTRVYNVVRSTGRAAVESAFLARHRTADELLVDVAASPILDGKGAPSGTVLALRDRTIQHSLEQEESDRERLSAFGRFAAGIAHEVKNPLAGIRGMAELLASRAVDTKTREAAELIVREAGRIAALVDDLMGFTQGESVRFAETNIHRVLDDVVELIAMESAESNVKIERRFDPSIPPLAADSDRLIQVFLNVARNALQALGGEGHLVIETRMTLHHRLTLESGRSVPTLLVSVNDDGPGIPPEMVEKVVTPLFTTRIGGTGLGLAVAQHWVARHEGTLRIESVLGEGTRVRVALPLRRMADANGGEDQ
jgi:two-component system nitrogen regulation sensor histidine kinase GlnL